MRVYRAFEQARGKFSRPIVTMGNFDGVHRGHAVILDQVVDDARQRSSKSLAITFQPHPVSVLRPSAAPKMLMELSDRLRTLRSWSLDAVVVQRFDQAFAEIEADAFIERFLVGCLDVHKMVVGHDVNFGCGRQGSIETLIEAGADFGFAVEVIQPVDVDGLVVHSTSVRKAVSDGDVDLALKLLGRPHTIRGRVVPGAGRGSGLGFATANIAPRKQLCPPEGVYATRTVIGDRVIDGVTSIGTAPTFGGTETVIEAHMFTEAEDFYGCTLALEFISHLRGQRRFDSPDQLVAQIGRDVEEAKAVLARTPR